MTNLIDEEVIANNIIETYTTGHWNIKSEGKRQLVFPSFTWEDNIKVNIIQNVGVTRSQGWNCLSINGSKFLLLGLGRFFRFLIPYTVCRTSWTGDQPVAIPLPTHRTAQAQNKRTQTSMHWVEFEPTILAFERAKSEATDYAIS
jgi:hypothetical protein